MACHQLPPTSPKLELLHVRSCLGGHAHASVPLEQYAAIDGGRKPKKEVDEVDPDGILHALDASVSFGVLVDVHLSEDTKDD